jgi:peptide/nickel transport system permease protein
MPVFLSIFRKKNRFGNEGSVYSIVWRKFLKSKLNIFFLFILLFSTVIAVTGYLITPDSTPFANKQFLELTLLKPGSSVEMLKIRKNTHVQKKVFFSKMLFGQDAFFDYLPVFKWSIEGDYLEAELLTGLTPNEGMTVRFHLIDVLEKADMQLPVRFEDDVYSWTSFSGEPMQSNRDEMISRIRKENIVTEKFLLGTDRFGRDVLSQLIIGARVSLAVGFVSVFISLLIGMTLGAMAGYFGGRTDSVIMWVINVVWAIPTLFLVIAITFALGKGFWQIFIAVGLTLWVEIARLVRGLVISVKNREYVEAARALGYSNRRIIMNHILPATLGPVIVVSAANFASAILIESGLSFLGIGIQPPMPSWGTMLRENYGFLIMDYAYLAIIPGLAIMLLVLTFMVIGNGIRDALDVREANS